MDAHARQQFDFLLMTAVERYAERLRQRHQSTAGARESLARDPEGAGSWLSEYVDALFRDFVLDNAAGASFVLQALARREAPEARENRGASIEESLVSMAKSAFQQILHAKTLEYLDQQLVFGD
jgi:hypothetical protein